MQLQLNPSIIRSDVFARLPYLETACEVRVITSEKFEKGSGASVIYHVLHRAARMAMCPIMAWQ